MERIDLIVTLIIGVAIIITATLPAYYLGKATAHYGR